MMMTMVILIIVSNNDDYNSNNIDAYDNKIINMIKIIIVLTILIK